MFGSGWAGFFGLGPGFGGSGFDKVARAFHSLSPSPEPAKALHQGQAFQGQVRLGQTGSRALSLTRTSLRRYGILWGDIPSLEYDKLMVIRQQDAVEQVEKRSIGTNNI
ncbi:hypothetical protein EV421DRAFT_1740049 [Armillaria borealis]|uniref:Uncharacterized protein n=1 Tax=Armillaria borealis TaxID=47425 RepID=A0AA39MI71_9AGAR|nr:hypothetical protein EV421DRAFT_1740049 [Armillaria borealis]